MSWHPLMKPTVIAFKATVDQINECIVDAERSLHSQMMRLKHHEVLKEPVHVRRLVNVIEGIEKKIVNLKEALRLKEEKS